MGREFMAKSEKAEWETRKWWMVVILLLLIVIIWWLMRKRNQPTIEPQSEPSVAAGVDIEDDALWLPDAIVESDERILEMKFGN
jgi:hypothetical protein